MKKLAAVIGVSVLALAIRSQAVPLLQVYMEGATYDTATETWVADFNAGDPIRLWAIGNVGGEGSKGTIFDVKLAIAYDSDDTPTISLTASTTEETTPGGYGGFTDPSTPIAAILSGGGNGTIPKLYDGSYLPSHDVYGEGTAWKQYSLGDFSSKDSPGGDFIDSLPTPLTGPSARLGYQINVYDVLITGTDQVHFDLYDHYQARNKAKAVFAPFSHDGEGHSVPDGGMTVGLLGMALATLGFAFRKLR